jgi:hypothetical protein
MKMKLLIVVVVSLIAVSCVQVSLAGELNVRANQPLSVSQLKERVIAPRIFSVEAYVVVKDDECPPCPPQAVCETCVFGIYISDRNDRPKGRALLTEGLYLVARDAGRYQLGAKYLFNIRYRIERNAAGAWQQTGPELIGSSLLEPGSKRE